MKNVEISDRYIVATRDALTTALAAAGVGLVRTERTSHLSAKLSGSVYVLEDVPGNALDFLIVDGPAPWRDAVWAVEVGRKTGKYSGNDRWRFTVRPYPARSREAELGMEADVRVRADFGEVAIVVGLWAQTFRRLRATLDADRLDRVPRWHASRYFKHLDDDEVLGVAGLFEAEIRARIDAGETVGLADANRLAERLLYRASRDAGWRKLTTRERNALGLVGGQWWPIDKIEARRGASPTGCGEATLAAASGSVAATVRVWR